MNKSFSFRQIVTFLIICCAIVGGIYLTQQTTFFAPKATVNTQSYQNIKTEVAPINSPDDLDQQIENLDSLNLNEIDKVLDSNSADANQF